jgi:hypothetical protein
VGVGPLNGGADMLRVGAPLPSQDSSGFTEAGKSGKTGRGRLRGATRPRARHAAAEPTKEVYHQ